MFRSLRNLFRRTRTTQSARRNRERATPASVQSRSRFSPRFDTLEDRITPSSLSGVTFPESTVLAKLVVSNGALRVFYTDEHALTLGCNSLTTIPSGGSTTTPYTVSPPPSQTVSPFSGTANPAQLGAPY